MPFMFALDFGKHCPYIHLMLINKTAENFLKAMADRVLKKKNCHGPFL